VADVRKAGKRLGWRPKVSTAEGVGRLLEWIGQNKQLFTV
jgi:nucleoside-diphosphate-sugar epimerase